MMSEVRCPYCSSEVEINHDDGQGYAEDVLHQQQCGKCDKIFTFSTTIHFSYELFRADCLNGESHNWKPTMTVPKEYTRMRCAICEEERQPTKEEREEYTIPDIPKNVE